MKKKGGSTKMAIGYHRQVSVWSTTLETSYSCLWNWNTCHAERLKFLGCCFWVRRLPHPGTTENGNSSVRPDFPLSSAAGVGVFGVPKGRVPWMLGNYFETTVSLGEKETNLIMVCKCMDAQGTSLLP